MLSAEVVTQALDELEALELLDSQGLNVVHSSDGNGRANGNGITRRQFGTRSAKVGAGLAAVPLVLSVNVSSAAAIRRPRSQCNTLLDRGLRHRARAAAPSWLLLLLPGGHCKTCAPTDLCETARNPPFHVRRRAGHRQQLLERKAMRLRPNPRGCCAAYRLEPAAGAASTLVTRP